MPDVKLRIPFDAFVRQQMLAEMHRRKRIAINGDQQSAGSQPVRAQLEDCSKTNGAPSLIPQNDSQGARLASTRMLFD